MYIRIVTLFLTLSLGVSANLTSKKKLQLMKHYMIQGEFDKAKIISFDLDQDNNYSKDIHYKYKAIIDFIEGKFQKSLKSIAKINKTVKYQKNICQLEMFNLIFIQDTDRLKEKWPNCYKISISDSKNGLTWLKALVDISTNSAPNLTKIPFKNIFIDNQNGDFLNLYLKLALYLNRQEIILPRVNKISEDQLKDRQTRELLALLYFRDNQLLKAYELAKDLNSPTALNMLASFFMAQNKKRLAYGKYKQALAIKSNSVNSLERLIPLSINLTEFKQAGKYVKMYNSLELPSEELKVLEAFLAIKNNEHKKAKGILTKIIKGKRGTQDLYVNRLMTLNAIAREDNIVFEKTILKSCTQGSFINCTLIPFSSHYEEGAKKLKQINDNGTIMEEDLAAYFNEEFDVDKVDDIIIVNQKDIEEIEDQKIELSKR